MVTHRGIEPRSTPSESATLSVELMGHIEYRFACGRHSRRRSFLFFFFNIGESLAVSPYGIHLDYRNKCLRVKLRKATLYEYAFTW